MKVAYSQASLPMVMGSSMPSARAATVQTRPATISFQPVKWNFFWNRPSSMAKTMKNSEMQPAAPLGGGGGGQLADAVNNLVGVEGAGHHVGEGGDDQQSEQPAEQQENLAAELADVLFNQQAMDLPSFLTLAYRAPKSVTAPKKMPPTRIHSSTGSQPKAAAWMAPVTGPAPAMEEKLMAEHRPAVGGDIVLAVLQPVGRG